MTVSTAPQQFLLRRLKGVFKILIETVSKMVEPILTVISAVLLPFLFVNHIRVTKTVPSQLLLKQGKPGIFFGFPLKGADRCQFYAGRPMKEEGHILCSGGPGSGKTQSMVKNTIKTWSGLQVILAIKGDLAAFCKRIARRTGRDIVVFSPMEQDSGVYYDPFAPVRRDLSNIAGHMWDIAAALIPDNGTKEQTIWVMTAQNFLAGALTYYYSRKKSFVEAIDLLSKKPVSDLVGEIMERGGDVAKSFVGALQDVPGNVLQNIGLELNSLARFCSIPAIRNALTDTGRGSLDWYAVSASKHPVMAVLAFPEASFDQCEPLYRLVINQLIKALETRSDIYDNPGMLPFLIQLDEFVRLGKVPAIIHGLSTLRSRGVSFALYIQSMANLESVYDIHGAREIRDNCAYHVVMNAMDVESQRYLSAMVGTVICPTLSANISATSPEEDSFDCLPTLNSSIQVGTERQPAVQPEKFRTLKQVVVASPYGVFQAGKSLPNIPRPAPARQHSVRGASFSVKRNSLRAAKPLCKGGAK